MPTWPANIFKRKVKLTFKLTFCIQDNYKTSMECQLDTGASCNVISHRDLSILLQNGSPPLNHSSVKLRLFDGSIMRTLGETHLTAEHEGKCHTLKFQVVDCTNKPLHPLKPVSEWVFWSSTSPLRNVWTWWKIWQTSLLQRKRS